VRDLTCPEVTDSAPGFALDILDATTRAQIAAHLIRCNDCRQTVTSMQCSAAELLDLGAPADRSPAERSPSERAPAEWPPPEWTTEEWLPDDFEQTGWPDRESQVRPARRRFRTVMTMAAAALLLMGSTFGPELEQLASHTEKPTVVADLTAAGAAVGTVRLFTGRLQAIDVSVRNLPESGTMDVVVVDKTGMATTVGRMEVARSRGAWLGHPPLALTGLTNLLLVDSQRRQIAAAALAV
jgi:hypothetical protein